MVALRLSSVDGRERHHSLLRERVEDEVDGAHEVELDDGAPGGALGCPCLWGEGELEVCEE